MDYNTEHCFWECLLLCDGYDSLFTHFFSKK